MTHDDILKAARERIAEIDAQIAPLAAERAKLQAMLGEQKPDDPIKRLLDNPTPWPQPSPLPVWPQPVWPNPHYPYLPPWGETWIVTTTPNVPIDTFGTLTLTDGTFGTTIDLGVVGALDSIVCGGLPLVPRGVRFAS